MSTVRQIIEAAYRKCGGIVAAGETPPAYLMQDGLGALKIMLDGWAIEGLVVYATLKQEFTWPASTAMRTIGPGPISNFDGTRPVQLQKYCSTSNGTDTKPLREILLDDFSLLGDDTTSDLPSYIYVNRTVPLAELYLWPIPESEVTLTLYSTLALNLPVDVDGVTDLSDDLDVPPGYELAIVYNLAVHLCPELGLEPTPNLVRQAVISKRNMKRANNRPITLQTEIPKGVSRYNIQAG